MVESVGDRIRLARESLEPVSMRQVELAHRLEVSQARLSNWERGDHQPPAEILRRISELLGVSRQWLVAGVGEPRTRRRFGTRTIPLFGAISAGLPASTYSDPDEIEIDAWEGDLPRWGRIIVGTSMISDPAEPDDLMPGDIAVFEERPAESGHVVQASRVDEDTVKVYRRISRSPWLLPVNPEFEAIPAINWQIRGVLVMRIRRRERDIVETVKYPHGLMLKVPQALTEGISREARAEESV